MVGMLAQCVTWCVAISRPASSRSQRGISTAVAPTCIAACMTPTMPVMWNIGTATRWMLCGVTLPQALRAIALCIAFAWLSMQPLGRPVVPLV
ncbi:hypothetical protein D3C72_1608430 [compost metagenome]